MILALQLWRDRRGRVSPLRVATLAVLLWPVLLAAGTAATVGLGGRPLNELIHRSGWWALVFLLASLAVTPLRRAGRWGTLIDVRRMIGVACFAYAALHLLLYVIDQDLNVVRVAREIVSRLYLFIGFVALLGLLALAATSNDTIIRRMGGLRWRRLHQATYVITILALVHYFQQTKADVSVPIAYAGLFGWLMGYRLLAGRLGEGALGPAALLGLTLVASALTFLAEAVTISWSFGQPITSFLPLYLGTLLDFDAGLRPGWIVLVGGLAVVLLDLVRRWTARPTAPPAAAMRPRGTTAG